VPRGEPPDLRLLELPPVTTTSTRSSAKAYHPAQGLRRGPLLYISGDPEARILLTRVARGWGPVTLLLAEGGRAGLHMARDRRPRMILLDARLPDIDGAQLVSSLRARGVATSAPVLVLAHDASPGERARFAWAGASAYMMKPLDISEVDRTVELLLDVTA
jgi:DNA-binding response OmpR family regulator